MVKKPAISAQVELNMCRPRRTIGDGMEGRWARAVMDRRRTPRAVRSQHDYPGAGDALLCGARRFVQAAKETCRGAFVEGGMCPEKAQDS